MQKRGVLDREAMAAADLTLQEMAALKLIGMTTEEAWEASRELFILTDPAKNYRE